MKIICKCCDTGCYRLATLRGRRRTCGQRSLASEGVRPVGPRPGRDPGSFPVEQLLLVLPIVRGLRTIGQGEGVIDGNFFLEEIDRADLVAHTQLLGGEPGGQWEEAQWPEDPV